MRKSKLIGFDTFAESITLNRCSGHRRRKADKLGKYHPEIDFLGKLGENINCKVLAEVFGGDEDESSLENPAFINSYAVLKGSGYHIKNRRKPRRSPWKERVGGDYGEMFQVVLRGGETLWLDDYGNIVNPKEEYREFRADTLKKWKKGENEKKGDFLNSKKRML